MKKTVSLILAVMMLLGCLSITAFAELSGEGTEANPYLASKLAEGDVFKNLSYVKNDTGADISIGTGASVWVDIGNGETKNVLDARLDWEWMVIAEISGNEYYVEASEAPAPEDPYSGTTTITATKAAPFTYKIVIPENVTGITAAGVYQVGQAKVENVVNATEKTVISYTATTGDFKLSTDTSKTMAATYYTEQAATNAFPTTAVKVYENKADAASIPTMWVKIADSDWNAAAAGTYTATVTFNFEVEEKETKLTIKTIADLLATVEGGFPAYVDKAPANTWTNGDISCMMFTYVDDSVEYLCPLAEPIILTTAEPTKISDKVYSYSQKVGDITMTLTFNLNDSGVLESIVLSGATEGNGTYTAPQPK